MNAYDKYSDQLQQLQEKLNLIRDPVQQSLPSPSASNQLLENSDDQEKMMKNSFLQKLFDEE